MRIVGVNIPDEKKARIALAYIYGVGRPAAIRILNAARVNPEKLAKDISGDEISRIQAILEKDHLVEGELRQRIRSNIARLKEIRAFRGIRHMRNLPVRGGRTKTNSRTVRGNIRKTAGSGRRKVELK